ncbi:C1 family peptidase [Aliikangiella sp. IMCC44359]|uniref:C1 family peptidase n=1 Tax=Aliikangiella sp. IMCC44359 TaxID=3459125 RepID=UPI00403AE17D
MDKFYQRTIQADLKDERDFLFSDKHQLDSLDKLPNIVDLRNKMLSPIIDQGLLNSCSACALSVAMEVHLEQEGKHFDNNGNQSVNASAMYIYYYERYIEDKLNSNAGVYIRDGLKSLANNGVCSESYWPYSSPPIPSEINTLIQKGDEAALMQAVANAQKNNQATIQKILAEKPSPEAIAQANSFKVPNYFQLSISEGINELRYCLSKGSPFIFGINEPESFFITPSSGKMALPTATETRLGGHALLAVGYDDNQQTFIVRNSYGKNFGDNGYCYMPYDFITGTFLQNGKETNNTFSFWCLLACD